MKSITLIEPNLVGHHKIYLNYFVENLLSQHCDVTVLTIPEFAANKFPIKIRFIGYKANYKLSTHFLTKKIAVFRNLFVTLNNLIQVKKKVRENDGLIFFCCIDDYMHELMPLWLFNKLITMDYSGLLFSPRYPKKKIRFSKLNILRSKYCKSICVLDEFCIDYLSILKKDIIYFPDFSDKASPNMHFSLIKEIQRKAKGRKIISLLGALTLRKGYKTFIESIKYLPPENYYFVIAGKLDKQDDAYFIDIFSKKENCLYYNYPIPTEGDFNGLVYISDIIYAAYVDFQQSSNMIAKASLFKKPIIVSKGSYMEEVIHKYNLGISINQHSPEECANAIVTLSIIGNNINRGFEQYLEKNSYSVLINSFQKVLSNISYKAE